MTFSIVASRTEGHVDELRQRRIAVEALDEEAVEGVPWNVEVEQADGPVDLPLRRHPARHQADAAGAVARLDGAVRPTARDALAAVDIEADGVVARRGIIGGRMLVALPQGRRHVVAETGRRAQRHASPVEVIEDGELAGREHGGAEIMG